MFFWAWLIPALNNFKYGNLLVATSGDKNTTALVRAYLHCHAYERVLGEQSIFGVLNFDMLSHECLSLYCKSW